jgi:hypothetical protein
MRRGAMAVLLVATACGGGGGGGGIDPGPPATVNLRIDRPDLVQSLSPGWSGAPDDPVPVTPQWEHFDADACELQPDENLVGGPGWRWLLRFQTTIWNLGGAPLAIGDPHAPLDPWTLDDFHFSPCHGHIHFTADWVAYRLLDSSGTEVAFGHKQGFCIEDVLGPDGEPIPRNSPRFNCEYMGIRASFADVYPRTVPGQWIDVTGVPAGEYVLEIEINPSGDVRFDETVEDLADNVVSVRIVIPATTPP